MKILFCTNKFSEISNGPAKFANLILEINTRYPEHEIRILTEDIDTSRPDVYRLNLRFPSALRLFSHCFRIQQYHQEAARIRKTDYPFDIIVYNNAFIGLRSTFKWKETIGMVNDYNNASRNWGNLKIDYTFSKQFLFKQLERITLRRQGVTIVNSLFLAQFLVRAYRISEDKLKVLYKGIVLPKSLNQLELNATQTIRVLFVKTDYILGGLPLLISALGRLPFSFQLTVIGPPKDAEAFLHEKLKDHANIVIDLKGYQPQEIVFQELLNTHLYISPSFREAFGVANLEAMSHGVPVISTKVGGIPEVLNYGKCGWLVEPGDSRALATAIKECIEQDALRKRKVQAGLEYCQRFSKEKVLSNFVSILTEVQKN